VYRVLSKELKTKIIGDNQLQTEDTGSPEVQVALLSERINLLSGHLNAHKKDFTSRVGLMRLVGKRKRLLTYLKREDPTRYEKLIKKLSLRK
jgi:small subunit ribosomal protein S15